MTNDSASKKKIVFLFILTLGIFCILVGYVIKDRQEEKRVITKGDRAPEFRLPDLDGRTVTLSDFQGKVVMVHFWATWCPPCVEEMPTLEKLFQSQRRSDFALLAINVDEGGSDVVTRFMKENRLTIPVLLDPEKAIARRYGTFRLPETYILDRRGVVRYKAVGPRDWSLPEHETMVRDIFDSR